MMAVMCGGSSYSFSNSHKEGKDINITKLNGGYYAYMLNCEYYNWINTHGEDFLILTPLRHTCWPRQLEAVWYKSPFNFAYDCYLLMLRNKTLLTWFSNAPVLFAQCCSFSHPSKMAGLSAMHMNVIRVNIASRHRSLLWPQGGS